MNPYFKVNYANIDRDIFNIARIEWIDKIIVCICEFEEDAGRLIAE